MRRRHFVGVAEQPRSQCGRIRSVTCRGQQCPARVHVIAAHRFWRFHGGADRRSPIAAKVQFRGCVRRIAPSGGETSSKERRRSTRRVSPVVRTDILVTQKLGRQPGSYQTGEEWAAASMAGALRQRCSLKPVPPCALQSSPATAIEHPSAYRSAAASRRR